MAASEQTTAATTKDKMIAGPLCMAATVPGRIKIPVPITMPIPIVIKSKAPSCLENFLSESR